MVNPLTNPFDFHGSAAVIVGGASGLGAAMAEGLARHGAAVCIVARSLEKAKKTAEGIGPAATCHALAADLSSESSVTQLADDLDRLFDGRVNIAVNCAGINVRNPIDRIALSEWEAIQRVNSTGAFLFARAMHPRLQRAGWGRLIHITSIFASRSFPGRTS